MLSYLAVAATSFSAPETSLQITCAPPAPAGSPPAAPTSDVTTPVSLGISWPSTPGAELYDVHVSLKTKWDPFVSLTSESNSAVVLDLTPGTDYLLAVRSRGARPAAWSALGSHVSCSTNGDATIDALIRPPQQSAGSAVVVSFAKAAAPGWTLHSRKAGSAGKFTPRPVESGSATATISDLDAGAEYDVYLEDENGRNGPIVPHRTSAAGVGFFEMFRISELCGDACEPDMLGDHDSGELLADVDFITHVASSDHFNISFNSSIVTRYCVERRVPKANDWADYLSCNGPTTTDYTCACNNWIDRCIGRLDISPCDLHPSGPGMPTCQCSAASLARSHAEVGKMPVYAPFPHFGGGKGPTTDWNCTATTPPASASHYLGSWYSTPSAAACTPGTSPAADDVEDGCSWSRRAAQHFVLGADLHALGFNTSDATDLPELEHNRKVVMDAFDLHPARCCGC